MIHVDTVYVDITPLASLISLQNVEIDGSLINLQAMHKNTMNTISHARLIRLIC